MAVMLALWAGCAPEPPPGPWAGCPDLDWSVRLTSSVYENVKRVVSLPDGDVVIAGDYEGSPLIGTDGTTLPDGYGARDVFVARLSPSGAVRWAHGLGGSGADALEGMNVQGDRVWVTGYAERGPLQRDRVDLDTTSGTESSGLDALAVAFDLQGELRFHVRLVDEGLQTFVSGSQDGEGNVFLLGIHSNETYVQGAWHHPNPPGSSGVNAQNLLLSFTASNRLRWLTTWGSDGDDRPFGVGWLGDHLVAGSSAPPGPFDVWVSGALAHQAEQPGMGLLAFDPATGRLDDWSVLWPDSPMFGHDATAQLFRADGSLQCAWWLGGRDDEDAFDAAFDGEGGLWVVGGFDEDLQVKDPLGQVLLDLPDEGNGRDGYLLRFAPPGPF